MTEAITIKAFPIYFVGCLNQGVLITHRRLNVSVEKLFSAEWGFFYHTQPSFIEATDEGTSHL